MFQSTIFITFLTNLFIVVLIITIYSKLVDSLQRSAQEQLKLLNYELNQNFYEELSTQTKRLSSLRHDFKNHLIIIAGRIQNNEYQEAVQYISSITDYINVSNELVITNHPTISSILLSKKAECDLKYIDINYEILFDKIYKISDMDLIIIFGNILDNAIEASVKENTLERRRINLSIRQIHTYLEIVCTNNYIDTPVDDQNGFLLSTKKNKIYHGLGLLNVHETCEKYNGEVTYSYSDQLFTIRILLPNY